jgi:hypothetical protein
MAFPAGAHDDAVDVLSIAVRGMNLVGNPPAKPKPPHPSQLAIHEPDDFTGF